MLTKAKIEAEIATLAAEVEAVARGRGRSLPTPNDLGDLLTALGVTLEMMASAREPGEDQAERLVAIFTPGEVAPAAEALGEAYLTLIGPVLVADRPAYFPALRALRPVLTDLLERRAEQWAERWSQTSRPFDLYRGACSWLTGASAPPPLSAGSGHTSAKWAAESVAKAKGWQRVVLAGLALNVAATELREWRDWIAGGAMKQHDFLLRERARPRVHADLLTVAFRGPLANHFREMAEQHEKSIAAGYRPGTTLEEWQAQQAGDTDSA